MNSTSLTRLTVSLLAFGALAIPTAFASEISGTLGGSASTPAPGTGSLTGTVTSPGSGSLSGTVSGSSNTSSSNSSGGGGGGGGGGIGLLVITGPNPLPGETATTITPSVLVPNTGGRGGLVPLSYATVPVVRHVATTRKSTVAKTIKSTTVHTSVNTATSSATSTASTTNANPEQAAAAVATSGLGVGGWIAGAVLVLLILGAAWLAWRASVL